MLVLQNISKNYRLGHTIIHALQDVSLKVKEGEFISVVGPSGSGKSTLLHIIGGLDTPTTGQVTFNEQDLHKMNDRQLSSYRSREIGFVFQTFNLISHFTALENVMLPLLFAKDGNINRLKKAEKALDIVGLGNRILHRPAELSGGQRQRVAIARALVTNPAMILADEPTGNLDSKTGEEIIQLLADLNKEQGITLLIITHDAYVADRADRVVKLMDGRIKA